MTVTKTAERSAPPLMARARAALGRPYVAGAVLLAVYIGLSFLNDPHGYLGTDTGAKVATLRIMALRHHFDPDIGYWAARWDPTARFHAFYQTAQVGKRYVVVTTLPALYPGELLYRMGGYRAALLVPEIGAVAAAFAGRGLARRLNASSGWAAFWVIGLASPITIYALDFWEHSLGVALVAWGVVALVDIYRGARSWPWGLVAGLLFGLAATMRTEALVYGGVATALICLAMLLGRARTAEGLRSSPPAARRALITAVLVGALAAGGLAVVLEANSALERAAVGSTLRSERVSGAATSGGSVGSLRIREAVATGAGMEPSLANKDLEGGCAVLLLLLVVAAGSSARRHRMLVLVAAAGVLLLYAARFRHGSGFVPGLAPTTPLAVVGLAWAWRSGLGRLIGGVAVLSLPLVWAFEFTGGALPQWGGRYILASGLLLGAVGVASLGKLERWARALFVGLAVGVTAFGLSWLSVRSHDVAHTAVALNQFRQPVLMSRLAFVVREWGAYDGTALDRRWLTAPTDGDLEPAAGVLQQAGVDTFATVELVTQPRLDRIGPYRRSGPGTKLKFLPGADLRVTPYQKG